MTNKMILVGTTWSAPSTAPGPIYPNPTIAGTISSPSDLTPFATSGDFGASAAMVDTTNFGSNGYTEVIPGLTTGDDIVIDLNADFAASQEWVIVNTTLGGIARPAGVPRYVDIKPTTAARSATNPSFVAAVWISKWTPAAGSVGAKASASLTLTVTGQFTYLVA